MIDLKSSFYMVKAFAKENSPEILTGIAIGGSVTTAYLAGIASIHAIRRLDNTPLVENMNRREKFLEVWDLYIPTVFSGGVTIACIVGANRISTKRALAAYSLLAVSEKTFEEYREKVVERIGEKKDKEIRDEIAQKKVSDNPPNNVLVAGSDGVLCCELFTGRYFHSDMESLKKAVNEVNAKAMREDYCVIGEFYYIIGIPHTSNSGRIGWTSDKLLVLDFTTTLTEDGKPCLAFDYNYTKVL